MVRKFAPLTGCVLVYSVGSGFRLLRGYPAKGIVMRSNVIGQRPAKPISNELRNACPPKAPALPLIYGISARPIGSSPIEEYTSSRAPERAGDFRTWQFSDKPTGTQRRRAMRSVIDSE
jgi:hypothetical protein